MDIKRGSVLVGDNGQLFRVIGETTKKLWPGQLNFSECIEVIGIVDGLPSVVYILKKDLRSYINVTEDIKNINLMYREMINEDDEEFLEIESENKKLRVDLGAAREKLEELKIAFGVAEKSIEEKDSIIREFTGSPEDIRKTQSGGGVEDIRNAYKNRGKI